MPFKMLTENYMCRLLFLKPTGPAFLELLLIFDKLRSRGFGRVVQLPVLNPQGTG
jgi:hypothetical protein